MAAVSTLSRALMEAFLRFFGGPLSTLTSSYFSLENPTDFSKFAKVKILNDNFSFEMPLFAYPWFLREPCESLLTDPTGSTEMLVPMPCLNKDIPLRVSTVETAIRESLYKELPCGVIHCEIGPADTQTPLKEEFYTAPGLLLNAQYEPMLLLTVSGRYSSIDPANMILSGSVEKYNVYINLKVFAQDTSLSKVIVKKILPFYLSSKVIPIGAFSSPSNIKRRKTLNVVGNPVGTYSTASVHFGMPDNIITSVKSPTSFEQIEENVYATLNSEGAIKQILDRPYAEGSLAYPYFI